MNKIYVVVRPGGEKSYVDKEPPEGILEWAKGLDVTIYEYRLAGVIHRPPVKISPKPPTAAAPRKT
jgi:hypothetical protein